MKTRIATTKPARVASALKAGRSVGFTLIEILIAMLVLLVGLAAIVSLLMTGQRVSGQSVDRSVAKLLIEEAIAEIERAHLITPDAAPGGFAAHIGEFIVTTRGVLGPDIGDADCADIPLGPGTTFGSQREVLRTALNMDKIVGGPPPPPPLYPDSMTWPYGNEPEYQVGQFNRGTDSSASGFLVIYRLEQYPNPADDPDLEGLYLLSLALYRDAMGNWPRQTTTMDLRLIQLTDPMLLVLRDRKVR